MVPHLACLGNGTLLVAVTLGNPVESFAESENSHGATEASTSGGSRVSVVLNCESLEMLQSTTTNLNEVRSLFAKNGNGNADGTDTNGSAVADAEKVG